MGTHFLPREGLECTGFHTLVSLRGRVFQQWPGAPTKHVLTSTRVPNEWTRVFYRGVPKRVEACTLRFQESGREYFTMASQNALKPVHSGPERMDKSVLPWRPKTRGRLYTQVPREWTTAFYHGVPKRVEDCTLRSLKNGQKCFTMASQNALKTVHSGS